MADFKKRTLFVTAIVLALGGALAASADDRSLLELANRALREANRQHAVQQQTGRVIQQLEAIIVAFDQNDLLERGNADQLQAVTDTLRRVHGQHVPRAAEHLHEARRQLQRMRPSLAAAGEELTMALHELQRIIDEAGLRVRSQALAQELHRLIQREQTLHEQTQQWARASLADPAAMAQQRDQIAARQAEIAPAIERFEQHLEQSSKDANEPAEAARLQRASQTLADVQPGRRLEEAAQSIRRDDPFAALEEQQQAIQAMTAAADQLQHDPIASPWEHDRLALLQQRREQIEQLRDAQVALRAQTEEADASGFQDLRGAMQTEQADLERRTGELARDPRAPLGEDPHLLRAEQAMAGAQQMIAEADQAGTAASQHQAETALNEAIHHLDRQIALAEMQPLIGTDLLADIDRLRQDQQTLVDQSQQTAAAGGELDQHQTPQQALAQRSELLAHGAPSAETAQTLRSAQQAMERAAEAMEAGAAQAMAQSQAEAMAALDQASQAAAQALEQLAAIMLAARQLGEMIQQQQDLIQAAGDVADGSQLSPLAPPQEALGQQAQQMGQLPGPMQAPLGEAAEAMARAGQAMQQGQQEETAEAQQRALDALQDAQQAFVQAMAQVGPMAMQAALLPGMPQLPGMPAPPEAGQAADLMPGPPSDQPGEIAFDRPGGAPADGADPVAGDARWQTLGARERQSLQQRFARELPAEYRTLLEAYYESLAD